jgi:potassium channel LctB
MERVLLIISVIFTTAIMFSSVKVIIKHPIIRNRVIPFTNLIALFIIYITIIAGFGLVYLSIIFLGNPILVENGRLLIEPFHDLLQTTIYFSAVTLFSVGYGDIVPIGYGRWIATFEALVGYILPAIFVLSSFQDRPRRHN